MANFITDSFSHTYAGEEFISELFYKPQEGSQAVAEIYRVMPNIKVKRNLYLPGTLQNIVKKYSSCGFSAAGGTMTITDKVLDVEKLKVNLELCVNEFDDTFIEEQMKTGVDINDMTGTVIEEITLRKVAEGIKEDIGRVAWFGSDASGSTNYDWFDGWIQLGIDDSTNLGQFVDMSTISGVENTSTGVLESGGSLALLRNMWENQSKVLRQMPKASKKFYVTSTVYDNLITSYEDTNSSLGLTKLTDGSETLMFRGVEVVEVTGWDTQLADANNPQASTIGDNLVVYTMPQNLVIGTDVSDPAAQLKVRSNDDDDEQLKIISKFKMGVQIVHPELMSIAY